MIPNSLLKHGSELDLNDGDKMTYLIVKMHQWDDDPAYPSSKRIAKLRGVSERSVERSSIKMQSLEYLKRPKGGRKPKWDFQALNEILDSITAGDLSLLEDAKKRVQKYVTVTKINELKRKKRVNSDKNDNLTVTPVSPEEDKIKKTKLNNKKTGNLVTSLLLDRNKNYFQDKQKNEERLETLRKARRKIQGTLN